jgi:hypothetical protein
LGWLLLSSIEPPVKRNAHENTRSVRAIIHRAKPRVIAEYEELQRTLIALLAEADGLALSRIKVVSPFNSRMRYSTYSAYRVIAAHQRRHLWQANRRAKSARGRAVTPLRSMFRPPTLRWRASASPPSSGAAGVVHPRVRILVSLRRADVSPARSTPAPQSGNPAGLRRGAGLRAHRHGLDTRHMAILASCFAAVILVPATIMSATAPGEIRWRFWPPHFSKRDIIYTAVSVPLSWAVVNLYFFHLNPGLASHWMLPASYNVNAVRRLVAGINCVGIWDELFFVNTVYGLLRGAFPRAHRQSAQAVVYTSVLYDMAFTGHGVWIVYLFALTQGLMYEKSRVLLWVLLVHLIVDLWLVLAILHWHYPGHAHGIF